MARVLLVMPSLALTLAAIVVAARMGASIVAAVLAAFVGGLGGRARVLRVALVRAVARAEGLVLLPREMLMQLLRRLADHVALLAVEIVSGLLARPHACRDTQRQPMKRRGSKLKASVPDDGGTTAGSVFFLPFSLW